MSLQVENLEKNMAKLTITVDAAEVEKALQNAYLKTRGKVNIPGFRKGKAPRQIIEKMYGAGIFYEDAVNEMIPDAYEAAAKESGLDIVSQPQIDVVQIEKGKEFIFTAEVAVKPEVELGKYKGIEVDKKDITVTDDEVAAELDRIREQNSRIVPVEDRAVADGDITTIDFEGFVDGEAFEGGKGTDYPLTIGSHSFIDTFEEQLIGVKIGEEVTVDVTFPEEYHAEELKGKPAQFKVTVKEIKVKELPELDDDFAQDVSEFDTLAEYKEDTKKKLEEKKANEAKGEKEDAIIEKIIEDSKMDIPEPMIDTQVRQMAEDFARRLQQQGLSVEQYFQFTGLNAETLVEQMKPQAVKRIQSRLVLEAIAKAEAIEVTEDDVNKEIDNMAAQYQMEADKLKEFMGDAEKEQMKMDIAVTKAVELVVNEAVEK
ncbi:MAG: trigger factor [Lachnospiraceae bacterium]|nr:trigger factor [Lachnospiraceae bacterium]MBQ4067642.1 trigger factor [Lachnospiraceae bacterium]